MDKLWQSTNSNIVSFDAVLIWTHEILLTTLNTSSLSSL